MKSAILLVSVPSRAVARKIARALLDKRLAACVSLIPRIESWYWWDGKQTASSESLLMIKTRTSLTSKLTALIETLHPYDTPEVATIRLDALNRRYLKWLNHETIHA